jgi:hypothetical protein
MLWEISVLIFNAFPLFNTFLKLVQIPEIFMGCGMGICQNVF